MPAVALSGSDTAVINNRILADLADGNCIELTYPNDIATVKIGKNGNAIYGLNQTGQLTEVKLRIVRGSADDNFLLALLAAQQANFSGNALMIGSFVKKIGDGQGNITSDTYILGGGVFKKQLEAKTNVEGEAEQSVVVYTVHFATGQRVLS